MNIKNKESLVLCFLFLVAQCLCMVEGEVHFYDFLVSTYYIILAFLYFGLKITKELPILVN